MLDDSPVHSTLSRLEHHLKMMEMEMIKLRADADLCTSSLRRQEKQLSGIEKDIKKILSRKSKSIPKLLPEPTLFDSIEDEYIPF